MRTIAPVNSLHYAGLSGGEAAIRLIDGSDWSLYTDCQAAIEKSYQKLAARPGGKSMPTHIDDPALQKAVEENTDDESKREQLVIRESVLILCQVPDARRNDVLASTLVPVYHYGFACTGLLAYEANASSFTVRLRQSDQSVLLEATQAMCALLSSRKLTRRTKRQLTSSGGSRVMEVSEITPVVTTFGQIELKAVGGDLVASGEVIQLSSSWKAYRYLLFDGPKRGLFLAGVALVAVSAGLRFGVEPPTHSIVDWIDGMVGRVATAAFGAQLVNSAIDYNSLAPASTRRGIRFEAGATVKWTWVDGRRRD